MIESKRHSQLIQLRVTVEEYDMLREIANNAGMALSPAIRLLLFQPATLHRVILQNANVSGSPDLTGTR